MNRHGLYAQLGFEYQKLVFVYFLLNIGKSNQITYEGCDDVEITADYFPLFKVYDDTNPNTFIQVKSGDVDKSILQKVFMNWLLILDRNKEYTLFLEKSISIDYQEVGFIDELIEGIIKTAKRKNAIIRQVKDKYIGRIDELREDLTWIINNFRVENNIVPDSTTCSTPMLGA